MLVADHLEAAAGDRLERTAQDPRGVTIADFVRVQSFDRGDAATLRRLIEVPALPPKWRERFLSQLQAVPGAET